MVERLNYLSHAYLYLDHPYFVAGLAIPDWLSMADRKVRVRSQAAEPWLASEDPRIRQIACGIMRHHEDDRWFHQSRLFVELNLQFALQLRTELPGDDGFRPSFLGHILIELLLDAELIHEDPARVDQYYNCLGHLSPEFVEKTVNAMAPRQTDRLQPLLPRFIAERFLPDYLDNERLWIRLNQIMNRVGLPRLPESLVPWLGEARRSVASARSSLLSSGLPQSKFNP